LLLSAQCSSAVFIAELAALPKDPSQGRELGEEQGGLGVPQFGTVSAFRVRVCVGVTGPRTCVSHITSIGLANVFEAWISDM